MAAECWGYHWNSSVLGHKVKFTHLRYSLSIKICPFLPIGPIRPLLQSSMMYYNLYTQYTHDVLWLLHSFCFLAVATTISCESFALNQKQNQDIKRNSFQAVLPLCRYLSSCCWCCWCRFCWVHSGNHVLWAGVIDPRLHNFQVHESKVLEIT